MFPLSHANIKIMIDLDNPGELKRLDPKDVIGSTGMFVSQCRQIWELAQDLEFPEDYKACQNIVVCGMGGSAYGGYVASSLFKDQLKIPLVSINDYHLPAFVNGKTLAILSSYSGGTEEVLSCKAEASGNGLKVTGITSGGKLGDFFKSVGVPSLVFDPRFNPSGQPRLGTGYVVLGTIALLKKLKFLALSDEEVNKALDELEADLENIKQKAKNMSKKIFGAIPIIVSAEFLAGNAHILRNQFNETAKSFSAFSHLPELNHHLMEGLTNPTGKKLFVLFIDSDLYSDKLKKRVKLTQDVVGKNNISFDKYKPSGVGKLSQILNVLSFGGYLSLYTAFLYGQDPSVIPWVDYFKKQLEAGN